MYKVGMKVEIVEGVLAAVADGNPKIVDPTRPFYGKEGVVFGVDESSAMYPYSVGFDDDGVLSHFIFSPDELKFIGYSADAPKFEFLDLKTFGA